MIPIEHVVFDVGRVLVHWDPELIYRDMIPDPQERQAFLEIIAPWNAEQDRGLRSWEEAEQVLIAQHPDKADWVRAFRRDWEKSVPKHHVETADFMRDLIARGVDVTLLSNANGETWRILEKNFPFLTEPRGATVSANVKLIKPDRAIYALHAQTFDLEPSRTLLLDDSPRNIAAARDAGWHGEVFEGSTGGTVLRDLLAGYAIADGQT